MKRTHTRNLIFIALTSLLAVASAHAQDTTPDSVKTRIGDLKFERGFPTEETKHKVFDEIDYQRNLDIMAPYLGTVSGTYTDWTPLHDRERLFPEDLDTTDPWQFKNVRV